MSQIEIPSTRWVLRGRSVGVGRPNAPRSLQAPAGRGARGDGTPVVPPASRSDTILFAAGMTFLLLLAFSPYIMRRCGCVPRRAVRARHLGRDDVETDPTRARERKEKIEAALVSQKVIPHDDSICIQGKQSEKSALSLKEKFTNESDSVTVPVNDSMEEGGGSECNKNEEDKKRESIMCGICLEDIRIGDDVAWSRSADACGHFFHRDCVAEWLMKHDDCPACRAVWLSPNSLSSAGAVESNVEAESAGAATLEAVGEVREKKDCPDATIRQFCVLHGIFAAGGGVE